MVRTKVMHGQSEHMEVTREFEGKEVKRISKKGIKLCCEVLKEI